MSQFLKFSAFSAIPGMKIQKLSGHFALNPAPRPSSKDPPKNFTQLWHLHVKRLRFWLAVKHI